MNIFEMNRNEARKEIAKVINSTPIEQLISELEECGAKFNNDSNCYTLNMSYQDSNVIDELSTFNEYEGQDRMKIWDFIRGKKKRSNRKVAA